MNGDDLVGYLVHGDPMCTDCWPETDMRCSVCDGRVAEW